MAVCDASEISRVGIARSLARHGLHVIAEVGDRAAAISIVHSGRAAVVLVDMHLPPKPDAAADVLAAAGAAGMIAIAVGVEGTPDDLFAALRLGDA